MLPSLIVILASLMLTGPEQGLEGRWAGSIEIPGSKLEFRIDFQRDDEDGDWQGKISIPLKKLTDIPLKDIDFSDGKASFSLSNTPGNPTFNGQLSPNGNLFTGEFTQSGETIPFVMSRSERGFAARRALAGLDPMIEEAMANFQVPGLALAVVVDDEVILARGYGFRNIEDQAPVTSRTLFAAGSTTKAMTSALLGTLVDEGALAWHKPVLDYLPDFRLHDEYATRSLTVRDLLTHRSGLPRHDLVWYNAAETSKQLYQRLRHLKPNREPRQSFQYQNLMYMVAGMIGARVTGETYPEAVRTRLLKPLGMHDSNFSIEVTRQITDHADPYRLVDGELKRVPFRETSAVAPAISLNTHVEDMARWVRFQLSDGRVGDVQILSPSTARAMHTPHVSAGGYPRSRNRFLQSYGLGWFIESYRGHYRVYHSGNIDGFTSLVSLLPLKKAGLVILANKWSAELPELLAFEITDRLLGLESSDWVGRARNSRLAGLENTEDIPDTEPPRRKRAKHAHPLKDYTGSYLNKGYGEVLIHLEDGKLHATYNRITTPLEHWHYERFRAMETPEGPTRGGLWFRFTNDMDGYVGDLSINLERAADPIEFQRQPDRDMTDPAFLSQFTGTYLLEGMVLSIEQKGNSLCAVIAGRPPRDLVPVRDTTFCLEVARDTRIEFERDKSGDVIRALIHRPGGTSVAERRE
ncbi:MAG: serine hydrolase [Acidobacteriota bacterium]|nr:serine hydrolase [Acidobacteriota bacterium]